jgi:MFS family permease
VLLYLACIATSLGLFMPFVHIAAYAQDHGLSRGTGALLVSIIGLGSAAGRLFLGGVADRFGRRRAVAAAFLGMGAMLLWWLASTAFWSLATFALLFGLCYGAFVALIPALTSDYFGTRNAGAIIGVLYTSVALGSAIGPYLAGWGYDVQESYTLPILLGAAANLAAGICMLTIAEPARWRRERE